MTNKQFLMLNKYRTSQLSIGPSTLRNQGAKGVLEITRHFLNGLKVESFIKANEYEFQKIINKATNDLLKKLPRKARNWGAARKAINLFLRDVLYNTYLNKKYSFNKIERFLEIPLDSFVVKGIRKDSKDYILPRWNGIKHLRPNESRIFQQRAYEIAKEKNIARVHLDLAYWRS